MQKQDPDLNVGQTSLLDNSAQRNKLAVKPKKKHRSVSAKYTPKPGER